LTVLPDLVCDLFVNRHPDHPPWCNNIFDDRSSSASNAIRSKSRVGIHDNPYLLIYNVRIDQDRRRTYPGQILNNRRSILDLDFNYWPRVDGIFCLVSRSRIDFRIIFRFSIGTINDYFRLYRGKYFF
jgi:hypothetical protein